MQIDSIGLKKYRNILELNLELHPKVNVFLGANGQGKTNLLEAIHFLIQGESFRPGTQEVFPYKSREEKSLSALIQGHIQKNGLTYTSDVRWTQGRKSHLLNNKGSSRKKLQEKFHGVLFSPESLAVIKSGPEERRRLIDELIGSLSSANLGLITDYKKYLKSRNRVLKDYKSGLVEESEALDLLESLNGHFIPLGVQLTAARIEAIIGLQPLFKSTVEELLGLKNVDISVDYFISSKSALKWSTEAISTALTQRLKELKKAELQSGLSLVGPHKHDINFLFGREDSRYFCSQGQQRALILAFKMAQISSYQEKQGDEPILLLDDVFSEFDGEKRMRLIEYLKSISSQIFITTTDFDFPKNFGGEMSVFKVENGLVTKVS